MEPGVASIPSLQLVAKVPLPVPSGTDALYILSLASAPDLSSLATSASDFQIHVFDRRSLQKIDTVHEVHYAPNNPNMVYSCSNDQTVRVWDFRSGSMVAKLGAPSELNSVSLNIAEAVLAAGTEDGKVLFWDPRTMKQVGHYEESFQEAVTQVLFHPTLPAKLYAGGLDNLISIFDVTVPTEDDAIVGVLNVEDDVHKMGCFGSSYEFVYCLTQTEAVSLYNGDSFDRISQFTDARQMAQVQYFVGGVYDPVSQRLIFVGGTYEGATILVNCVPGSLTPLVAAEGAHEETIRCCDWQQDMLVTAGEDSRLCVWKAFVG